MDNVIRLVEIWMGSIRYVNFFEFNCNMVIDWWVL